MILVIGVLLLLVPNMVVPKCQKQLPSCVFHTLQCLAFTGKQCNKQKKKQNIHVREMLCATFLMREVRGELPRFLKVTEQVQLK